MSAPELTGFEVIEKLGEGGMATVWKARQISLDRVVAVKIMSARLATDPDDVERFQSEARSAARLKHLGIVQVYDANIENGLYYFVMEYVAGYTVGDWIRRRGRLPEDETLVVADCVADALGYAWATAGIIHCDIKPDNVMIDADGTVKVADLGLARTIGAMSSDEREEQVMGTPAYIAPEQAAGHANLDCRADIYSLGAMMYHMLTGRYMFQGEPEEEILALQIAAEAAPVRDLNPDVSDAMGELVGDMLAKDPDDRLGDWEAVRKAIRDVRDAQVRPRGVGATVTRRLRIDRERLNELRQTVNEPSVRFLSPLRAVIILVGLAVMAALSYFVAQQIREGKLALPPPASAPVETGAPPAAPPRPAPLAERPESRGEDPGAALYADALRWDREHPLQPHAAARRFQRVAEEARGTRYAVKAEEQLTRLQGVQAQLPGRILQHLRDEARPLLAAGRHGEAAALFEAYTGEGAAETRHQRHMVAAKLRRAAAALAAHTAAAPPDEPSAPPSAPDAESTPDAEAGPDAAAADPYVETCLREAASRLLREGLPAARAALDEAQSRGGTGEDRDVLAAAAMLLQDAENIDRRVLSSFEQQQGRRIPVEFKQGGLREVEIRQVDAVEIHAVVRRASGRGSASTHLRFSPDDLSLRERMRRMGGDSAADANLVRGLLAVQAGSFEHAARYFAGVPEPFSSALLEELVRTEDRQREAAAERELRNLLVRAGFEIPAQFDARAWHKAVEGGRLGLDKAYLFRKSFEQWVLEYGNSAVAEKAARLLSDLDRMIGAGAYGRRGISRLPADVQAALNNPDAVRQLLLQRNPGLEPSEIAMEKTDAGHVEKVVMITHSLRDIAPLGALRRLRHVTCAGSRHPGSGSPRSPLKDLTPLTGLPLENLRIPRTSVEDLGPLRGMPLVLLDARESAVDSVRDLSLLPLEVLDLSETMVRDISPLRDKDITALHLRRTRVFDFSVLRTLPLERLDVAHTQFRDVSVLDGKPLKFLDISGTHVQAAGALGGLPLEHLMLSGAPIRDFSFLSRLTLQTLDASNTELRDLAPLAGQPIGELDLAGTKVETFGLLGSLPLRELSLRGCEVTSIECLQGEGLVRLDLAGTGVDDLKPLRGMPLTFLDCRGTKVRDLTPLKRMPLTSIHVDDITPAMKQVLETMPALKTVNGEPF